MIDPALKSFIVGLVLIALGLWMALRGWDGYGSAALGGTFGIVLAFAGGVLVYRVW